MRQLAFLPAFPILSTLPFRRTTIQFRKHLTIRARHPTACLTQKNMPPLTTQPFSNFSTNFFLQRHPSLAPHLTHQQIALAASVYLFRYDNRISVQFITGKLDTLSKTIADHSGKSIPEARRLFTSAIKDAAREYFKHGWHDVDKFIHANAKDLTAVRMQSTTYTALTDQLACESVPEVDPVILLSLLDQRPHRQRLLEPRPPLMVLIYADYCSVCKQVRPLFEQAFTEMHKQIRFVKLNGPRFPEVKEQYPFTSYPMILRCDSATQVIPFPKSDFPMTVQNITSFANNYQLQPADSNQHTADNDLCKLSSQRSRTFEWETTLKKHTIDEIDSNEDNSDDDIRKLSTQRSRTYEWETMLKKHGIDEIDALRNERQEALRSVIDSTLESPGCDDSSCPITPSRSHDLENGDAPPLCVLLGGGMGAGKSTTVGLISETPFWKEHGEGIVIAEADVCKLNDPLYHFSQSVSPTASRIVHKDSIHAAEDLFVAAVNARRDIIFDGTLSWSEYARQTVMMLRDTEYYWKRGQGYVETDGGISEQYWERGEKREWPAPGYRVELVGVTAHPEISVMRGIVRKMTTGRGVPIPDQLRSHALFSKHFEEYIDMVHAVYLFDTTMDEQFVDSPGGYARQLVAIKPGLLFPNPDDADDVNDFVVRNPAAYERFLMKKFINTNAKSTSELYHSTVLIS